MLIPGPTSCRGCAARCASFLMVRHQSLTGGSCRSWQRYCSWRTRDQCSDSCSRGCTACRLAASGSSWTASACRPAPAHLHITFSLSDIHLGGLAGLDSWRLSGNRDPSPSPVPTLDSVHVYVQIKEAADAYEAARLDRMSLGSADSQAPRAVLADVMFSLLEFKPLQQHLR